MPAKQIFFASLSRFLGLYISLAIVMCGVFFIATTHMPKSYNGEAPGFRLPGSLVIGYFLVGVGLVGTAVTLTVLWLRARRRRLSLG